MSYSKTTWSASDPITAEKLNKIEDQLETTITTTDLSNVVANFYSTSSSTTYSAGDYCLYESSGEIKLYKCNNATIGGSWNNEYWDLVKVTNEIKNIKNYEINIMNTIAPDFDSSVSYSAGQIVWYDGTLYRFTTNHSGTWAASDAKAIIISDSMEAASDLDNLILYVDGYGGNAYTGKIYGYNRLAATKIITTDIMTMGDNIIISTSNNDIKFALVTSGGSTITAWKTGSYTSASTEWSNGLKLWIQKIDGGNISDNEAIAYVNSFTLTYDIKNVDQKIRAAKYAAYVSTSGNDTTNDGTAAHPFATVNHALSLGYKHILMLGGIYAQQIDLSNISDGEIEIANCDTTANPVFVDPSLIKITSASVHSGNVYVASINDSVLENVSYIFQDGVNDTRTEITAIARMPQQRGRQYRCTDTKIIRCLAKTLADAVSEMAADSDYKFFYDKTNHQLYFTAPSSDFANHSICCGHYVGLFQNSTRRHTLKIIGIECKYIRMNLDNTSNSIVSYCKASCAYAPTSGQYTWDDAINTTFTSCEACLSSGQYTTNDGDGFNAHAIIGEESNDPFTHRTGATLNNCWSHDNKDDGYSEHQRAESTIIGGLYEYNGKGGVTPSYGCHTECIGVVSRHNWNGFVCCNGANNAEGGQGTQMECIDCVAYNNISSTTGYGFVCYSQSSERTRNTMICIRCSSYGNTRCGYAIGQSSTQTYDYGRLVDCKASNNGVSAYRAYGTIEIINNNDVVAQ